MNNLNKIRKFIELLTIYMIFTFFTFSVIKYLKKVNPFEINKISIHGNNFLDNNIIEELINVKIKNKTLIDINKNEIKNYIIDNDFIKDVKIYTEFPCCLHINITEVNPIALIQRNEKIYFIDNDLNLIPTTIESLNYFTNIPIITNLSSSNNQDLILTGEIINQILNKAEDIYDKLDEIRFYNDRIILHIGQNTEIIFSNKDYKNSLNKLFGFNNQVIKNKGIDIEKIYETINLTVSKQIITIEKKLEI